MDEDNQDGPFAVWQMFNAPIMVLFNNLEHAEDGLDRLLTSILKLSGDSSEVIVPRAGSSTTLNTYYYAFNTWLIGRLFYICSVKELQRLHETSIGAQLKVINILCINRADFHETLLLQYYSIMNQLIRYYQNFKEQNENKIELKNFTPDQIHIPQVKLNLEPIYVVIDNTDNCKTLIDLVLMLLSESIPPCLMYMNTLKSETNNILKNTLSLMETCSAELKLVCLKFFVNFLKNINAVSIVTFHKEYFNIHNQLLIIVDAFVQSFNFLYEKQEIDDVFINDANTLILCFLKTQSYGDCQQVIVSIASTVLNRTNGKLFNKELKIYCLSLSKDIELPKHIIELQNKDAHEIEMLMECYVKSILFNIRNKEILQEIWHYNEVSKCIESFKVCDDISTDEFLMSHYLNITNVALKILQNVEVEYSEDKSRSGDIEVLSNESRRHILNTISKVIKEKRNMILSNENLLKSLLEVVTNTILLNRSLLNNEINNVLKILCLQTDHIFAESNILLFNDTAKIIILENLMLIKVILRNRVNDNWNKIIMNISNAFQNKSRNICFIYMCPLLLASKVYSTSKLIGEILMPAFLSKDKMLQKAIIEVVPIIACMSLGTYSIAYSNESLWHPVLPMKNISMRINCMQCDYPETHKIEDSDNKKHIIQKFETNTLASTNKSMVNSIKILFGKFLNFSQYTDLDAPEYWNLFRKLCNHYYVFNYGVSKNVLNENNTKYIHQAMKSIVERSQPNENFDTIIKDEVFEICVNLLITSTRKSLESNDYALQSQTCDNIKEFGLYINNKVLLPVTKLLVYYIMQPHCPLAPKAVVYVREVCERQGFTPNQAYHRYKKDYCRLFVACSLNNGKDFAISLLKVVRAFGFVGYRDFISKDVHHFLPYLIPYCVTVKEVSYMIQEIASLVQCSESDFLSERFPHIYVHVYLTENKDVAKKCFDIIEKITKTSILNLIKRHFRVILTEFLLQYCCNPEKVLNACRYLACHDPDSSISVSNMSMSTSQIADFLNPKFLGVLAYFDHKLVNAKVALSVKRKALQSFPDIMQLMGVKYLTPLRYKVLATLRSALPLAKEFPKIVADAWGAFIHNMDTIVLGPILSNLTVSLLQQISHAPHEINKIFQYLVISNENLLSSHISDLFFVESSEVTEKVKIVIRRHVKRTQPDAFLDRIMWYLNHLNKDIPSIKVYVFTHLNKVLKSNRSEIHKAIFGGKNIDPVMVEFIDCLLTGCKDTNSKVSLSSGGCLGQLGAIEAGHLPRQYVQPDRSPFAFSISDNCFAATALMELTRAFQYEKDTTNMDCYALTIQEILKIYDISPTGSKKEVWNSFPENMHQIMYPLLSSRYTLAYPSQAKKVHPLFGTVHATTFLEWAHNWAGQLIPLIESDSIRDLLRTVHPSMRRDVRTLFLFLPYVLLHAVMSKGNVQYIQEEMLAVINACVDNCENDIEVTTERSKYKLLRHIRMTPTLHSVQAEEGNQSKCSKTVYTMLDFLNKWLLEWTHSKQKPLENENYKSILGFLDKFDKLAIAKGNFACGELERALQYLEMYMDEDKERIQGQLSFLAEIYALLDDPDFVAGILSIKRSEPSLKELILAQVVTGRLQDAALCYERLAQEGQMDRHSLQGMIECYLGLDQPFTAYRLLSEHELNDNMMDLSAEPLWRLGRFEQLDDLAKKPIPPSRENWGLLMGRILLSYRNQEHEVFETCCSDAMSRLLVYMDGETRGESALRSDYQSVLGLHIVSEAGHTEEVFRKLKDLNDGDRLGENVINQLLDEWRQRLSLVQSDVRTVEPLLRIRRILLQQTQELLEPTHPTTSAKLRSCIGDLWLQSAKHARKAGILQQSYMYILNAEEYQPEQLFIEKSKMYWARGQQEHAFTTLRRGLDEAYPQIERLNQEQRKICAKAKLLIAKYNDETTNVDVDVNIGYYKEAVDVFKQWEKSLVSLGAFYEKVGSSDVTSDSGIMWTRRIYALNSYGKALQYGHKYLYQSMPRMLSIWLDVEVSTSDTSIHSVLAQMTEIIKTYSERLPIYLYLTAFSQIVSRICHPVKEVYQQLKAIIVKLIQAYPQHTLWMMMCVIKSSYPQRIKRCSDVFADPRLKEPHILKLICDFTQLAEKLIELCNKPIAGSGSSTTVSSLVRTLPRLLASENFSHIMMPFQEFCKIVLPSKAARQERIDFNIPTEPPVYIAGIDEQIQILPSLQKPRKVTLKGSDGKSYIIMLKPRDDLRKDFRLMEFNGVVNRFLQDAPETRQRRLYIRTYSVLPLNEECGLIEWVPNLVGLRPVLMHIYKQKGIHTSNRELKEMMCSNKDPVEKKRRIYEQQLLPRHPPVFQEWFRRVFSDPYGWYQARSAYIRTTAVMSMVGYILGLGDRHGENISFDSTNGDTVHVDFNCLFNKGEAFEWPERVPFRLTHNMEAAMGPLKYEGMFRKSCEAVMRALRCQTPALMSVVGPFVYDPLVSWGRSRTAPVDCAERTNDLALQHLSHIRHRLNGMVKTKNKHLSLSLSPEGQVEHLIVEATSVYNLCQMYIGWGPFL